MPKLLHASLARRLAVQFIGSGPRKVLPLAEILKRFEPDRAEWGWCGPERTWEPIERFTAAAFNYPAAAHVGTPVHEMLGGTSRFLDPFVASEHRCIAYALPDAAIIGRDGLIYHAPSRTAVRETTVQWWQVGDLSPELWAPRRQPPTRMAGTALCLRCLGGNSFYHLLTESLSRLAVLRDFVDFADHILVSATSAAWAIAWIEQAGIPREKLIFCDGNTHLVFDGLFFATPFLKEQQPTPAHIAALTALYFGQSDKDAPDRHRTAIYLSRKDADMRQWAGEVDFCSQNPQLEVVTLAGLSPRAQRDIFARAGLIVGVHGANLANLAFCRPPFHVIELFPERGYAPMYYRWSKAAGGTHVAVHLAGTPEQQAAQASQAARKASLQGGL